MSTKRAGLLLQLNFLHLWNWFAESTWKSLEMQTREALEFCKQNLWEILVEVQKRRILAEL